jgi:hypothetical protein
VYGLRATVPLLVYWKKFFLEKWPFFLTACALADVASSLQAYEASKFNQLIWELPDEKFVRYDRFQREARKNSNA